MKVAVVEPVGGHGGMHYYDFALCQGLLAAGVRPVLFTSDVTSDLSRGEVCVQRVYRRVFGAGPKWRRGLRFLAGTGSALARARAQGVPIAHFHFFQVGWQELVNVLLAKSMGMRVVVTAHDIETLAAPTPGGRLLAQRVYRLCDRVVAHNRTCAEAVESVLGVRRTRIHVIPHGSYLPYARPTPDAARCRRALALPGEGPLLLFFGQIKGTKGLDVLLEAFAELRRTRPDAHLVVAGKTWKDDLDRYLGIIAARGLERHCTLHIGFVPDERVPLYFGAADLIVAPYRRIYQSGVLLMAMSFGLPVVASDLPAMRESIEDGKTGFLFRNGDARDLASVLAVALASPECRRRVRDAALEHVQRSHDWTWIGRMTADCYRTL